VIRAVWPSPSLRRAMFASRVWVTVGALQAASNKRHTMC